MTAHGKVQVEQRSTPPKLVLFMTRGMSLTAWDRLGMFERETALYRALRPLVGGVAIVSYGGPEELAHSRRLPGIDILHNRWNLPERLYARLAPILHARALLRADVFKTNQTNGAEVALAAAHLHHKPLIARCGYMWSDFVARGAEPQYRLHQVERIERSVFGQATMVVVTTEAMRETISMRYLVPPARIQVIPNYVRTDLFFPQPEKREEGLVCFAGRLDEQKNPLVLVDALEGLGLRLLVIGQGPLQGAIQERAKAVGVDVQFAGQVEHTALPGYLNRAQLFVLPSHYEGHPKTLLEAMSCGLPVVGADSPGIREVIRHGETGYLCATDASSIRATIQTLLAEEAMREQLGHNARQYVLENLALERIVQLEFDALTTVVHGGELRHPFQTVRRVSRGFPS